MTPKMVLFDLQKRQATAIPDDICASAEQISR